MRAAAPRTGEGPRRLEIDLPAARRGARLDQVLAAILPGSSRASVQRLLREGHVVLDDRPARAAYRVRGGERVRVDLPPPAPSALTPEPTTLQVLHEDADVVVINKPPGLTVHPGAGVRSGTLVNALLHHCRDLSGIGGVERPGIVHRLDRDTSGVIVVAKHDAAHRALSAQFKARSVGKVYEALVWGRPRVPAGVIDAPVARHPTARVRMAVRRGGRPARTAWRLAEELGSLALLDLRPETGRTHQLRVHLSSIGHPIVGDPLYGRQAAPRGAPPELVPILAAYGGMALHAREIAFDHPRTGRRMVLRAERPEELECLLASLRQAFPGAAGRR
ncbi:MAG TPA: RluA family pseudouridine synthase [Candidatus Cryosericum sp.]|nr:RluA family pseudouridine synthase [Candidatus Cryosericum sp.]